MQKKAEHLQRIERHILVADNVITTLSNFAKLPVPARASFALADCVRDVLETNLLSENCAVSLDCCASLPPVLADIDQMRIVLGNLVRNAREAMPQGGQLSIGCRQDSEHVEIAVSDTGVGIAPEDLARIMEPLYSTKARGLGLGLAIARAILEKNNGSLRVTSTPGKGSTFTVRLQAAAVEGSAP